MSETTTTIGRTVYVQIPKGYQVRVTEAINANPDMSAVDAALTFVQSKYGSYIRSNLSDAFIIEMDGTDGFNVHFENPSEANTFMRTVGGR